MANIVNNIMFIKGDKETLDAMMNDAVTNDGKYTFSSWLPMPETFSKCDTTNHPYGKGMVVGEEFFSPNDAENNGKIITQELIDAYVAESKYQSEIYGVIGWYDWGKKYWGTKWDAELDIERVDDTTLKVFCETAWYAPEAFIVFLTKNYDVEISMYSHNEDSHNEVYFAEKGYVTDGALDDFAEEVRGFLVEYCRDRDVFSSDEEQKIWYDNIDDFVNGERWDITCLVCGYNDELVDEYLFYLECIGVLK